MSYLAEWPRLRSDRPSDPELERRIRAILAQMTLEEKIGQMIQPELYQITPEEAGAYKFGSILNGAGLFPGGDRYTSPAGWTATVDAFWRSVDAAFTDRPFRIPLMWATDAVHGHNNVFGATIFPHNIGLGCARDPELIRRIGAATAREVAATGMDWTFAPNVTTPRDYRWGRHFEGYSENPGVVARYARAMVEGLQGPVRGADTAVSDTAIACTKHWLADGGTRLGIDRGDCDADEDLLRNIHAAGYFSGIEAGAQSVMISFSGWRHPANYDHSPDLPGSYNYKLCGSRRLITDVLKDRMGFDGLVLTDWDAHAEVSRCSFGDAAYVFNAGVDVLMVSPRHAWKALYQTSARQVRDGVIPIARVDDAVLRVLRVKMRAGLWDKPAPAARPSTQNPEMFGCAAHRDLAREAVRKSAVLLKNNDAALPLPRDARVLVTGTAARNIQKQTGGWSLSWQGNDNGPGDFPGALTVADAIGAIVGSGNIVVDPDLSFAEPEEFDAVVVAMGEDAYAEMRGNIRPWRTLAYATLKVSYAIDLAILRRLREAADRSSRPARIVSLFFTGRPLYATEEINLSDAFVVGWLPGPYLDALAALIFTPAAGEPAHDFTGRLSFSWPRRKRDFELNHAPAHLAGSALGEALASRPYDPLFPFGYGLSYAASAALPHLPLDEPDETAPVVPATSGFAILPDPADDELEWKIYGHNFWSGQNVNFREDLDLLIMRMERLNGSDETGGLKIAFKGFDALIFARYRDGLPRDFRPFAAADAFFRLRVKIFSPPDAPIYLCVHDDYPSQPGFDIAPQLRGLSGEWQAIDVPLRALEGVGMELDNVDTPFMLYSDGMADMAIADVRLVVPSARSSA